MPQALIALTVPVLTSPVISGSTFSIDADSLAFSYAVDAETVAITVEFENQLKVVVPVNLTQSLVDGTRTVSGSINLPATFGEYTLRTFGHNHIDPTQATKVSSYSALVVIFTQKVMEARTTPPAGIKVYRYKDTCKVEWVTPTNDGFSGVRVQFSTDESGLDVPYVQLGTLVKNVSRVSRDILTTESITRPEQSGYVEVTTSTKRYVDVNYSSIEIKRNQINAEEFYVVLTTVVYDTASNHIFESVQSAPIKCAFVDLHKVQVTDFLPYQEQTDIATRLIINIAERYPELDLSPRSEIRDLFVDPVAIEFANASVREWFTRVSESISALVQLDDGDGDGISDPVESSTLKQIIGRAYNIDYTTVQTVIDKQFDIQAEISGITRGGAESATVSVYCYTFTKPTQRVQFLDGAVVATIPDQTTPALSFVLRGSATLDPANADAFYNAEMNCWGVTIPAECQVPGTVGNVGAGTIRRVVTGIPSGFLVKNFIPADYGLDRQDNIKLAAQIQDRRITGVDSGTRNGYLTTARAAYGVVDVKVVASGDSEMLRDWDPIRKKHVYGCVDVYVHGRSSSEQIDQVPYKYVNSAQRGVQSTYSPARVINVAKFQAQILPEALVALQSVPYAVIELYVDRDQGSFYLGTNNARINPVDGTITLDPNDGTYTISKDGEPVPRLDGAHQPILNRTAFSSANVRNGDGRPTLRALLRLNSGIEVTPENQPLLKVTSIVGDGPSQFLDPNKYRLIRSSDPLLEGSSNRASDLVEINNYTYLAEFRPTFLEGGTDTFTIDTGIDLSVNLDGTLGNMVVRSADFGTLYTQNQDYALVQQGPYHTYAIKRLQNSLIPLGSEIVVSYNKWKLIEQIQFVDGEEQQLNGTSPTVLDHAGIIDEAWVLHSYGETTLLADPALSSIVWSRRFIKVVYNGQLMHEGTDYLLEIDELSGKTQISRFQSDNTVTSRIPDSATVSVSYYHYEVFSISTQFPSFITQIAERLEATRHAAADVLVKSMQDNAVDVALTVELENNARPEIVDPKVRTVIGIVLDRAQGKLSQAELIRQVKGVSGVKDVIVPLSRFVKADGGYEIGHLIPTGTKWIPVTSDPDFSGKGFNSSCYITAAPVLPTMCLPSGGESDAFVGMLYEGEAFERTHSIEEFKDAQNPSFYIIGLNDHFDEFTLVRSANYGRVMLLPKQEMHAPSNYPFRVTYQVHGEAGAKNLVLSPTEYLRAGRISVDYVMDQVRK